MDSRDADDWAKDADAARRGAEDGWSRPAAAGESAAPSSTHPSPIPLPDEAPADAPVFDRAELVLEAGAERYSRGWHRIQRLAAMAAAVGWTGWIIAQTIQSMGRHDPPRVYSLIGLLVLSVGSLLYGLISRSRTLRILAAGIIGTGAVAGAFNALCQIDIIIRFGGYMGLSPNEELWWGLAALGSLIAAVLAAGLTRSEISVVWRAARAQRKPAAASWDEVAQVEERRKIPLVGKGQNLYRILAVIPIVVTFAFGTAGLVAMAIFSGRMGADGLGLLAICFGILAFYTHGMYSPVWLTRFLSIAASGALAWSFVIWMLSAEVLVMTDHDQPPVGALIMLPVVAILAGACLWGTWKYAHGELDRLADKARARAQPKEEDLHDDLDGGRWDQARPGK